MHRESNGSLRWFAVMGALAGMFLYKKTVGRFLVRYLSMALCHVRDLLCRIMGFACALWAKRAMRRAAHWDVC